MSQDLSKGIAGIVTGCNRSFRQIRPNTPEKTSHTPPIAERMVLARVGGGRHREELARRAALGSSSRQIQEEREMSRTGVTTILGLLLAVWSVQAAAEPITFEFTGVVFLVEDDPDMELPSDIQGIGYIPITSDLGVTRLKLQNELIAAKLIKKVGEDSFSEKETRVKNRNGENYNAELVEAIVISALVKALRVEDEEARGAGHRSGHATR